MLLTDTHCHLDFNKFDADRADVLLRAQQAGVSRILIPGLSLTSSQAVVKLAESHPMLFAAIGVHPTEVVSFQVDTLTGLYALVLESGGLSQRQELVPALPKKIVAIGEIGLDYYWDTAPHDQQQHVLKDQLGLAAELELPVVIHFREKGDAIDGPCASDLLEILEEWVSRLRREKSPLAGRPGVLHSFSGSQPTAQRAIGLNFFLGVTGPLTYRKERQELVASLPLDCLLLETDAPFLAPAPLRGKRNEPANVRLIADKIAALHTCNLEDIAAATSANATRLFGWEN